MVEKTKAETFAAMQGLGFLFMKERLLFKHLFRNIKLKRPRIFKIHWKIYMAVLKWIEKI